MSASFPGGPVGQQSFLIALHFLITERVVNTTVDPELYYYAKMFAKIRNKKYEFFVISAIIHILNDQEIEFTTQQIVRSNGKYYLMDLYFPQLKIAIEIDEPYHTKQSSIDRVREEAVVEKTGIKFQRIAIGNKSIGKLYSDISEIVSLLKEKKEELQGLNKFNRFEFGEKYDTNFWLQRKSLSRFEDARFKTHVEVAKLFGKTYLGHQRAIIKLNDNYVVWFPKLYQNKDWNNEITPDGNTIIMKRISSKNNPTTVVAKNYFVFAHHNDEFGQIFYAFKGVFRPKQANGTDVIFELVADSFEFDESGWKLPNF